MDKQTKLYIIGFFALSLISYFIFSHLKQSPEKVATQRKVKRKLQVQKPETAQSEDAEESASEVSEDIQVRKDFEKLIVDIKSTVTKCREGIEKIFPEKNLDGENLPYNSPDDIKSALDQYYNLVNEKIIKTDQLVVFFTEKPINKLDHKMAFEQLSQIEDCGEFQEESIIDAIIASESINQWDSESKKDIAVHLIKNFKKQLAHPVGLHHIISKIEALDSLIDEDFISEDFEQEISRLNIIIDDSEDDFRSIVPPDFTGKKFLSPDEILQIKLKEKEITDKVKQQFLEVLNALERLMI